MKTYRVVAPHFISALIVDTDQVLQSAPILSWAVGKNWEVVRDYCKQKGWTIEPVIEDSHPQWVEVDGLAFELIWNGEVLTRVIKHSREGTVELRYRDLPEQIKNIL